MKNLITKTLIAVSFGITSAIIFQAKAESAAAHIIDIAVTTKGFEPSSIQAKPGEMTSLRITRKTDATCAKQIKISKLNIKKDLPLGTPVIVELGKLGKGEVKFACGMDMVGGTILVK